MAIASVALAVVFFLMPAFRIGRGIFFVFIVLAWVFLLLWRLFLLWAWGTFGAFGDRVLILGTGLPAQKVAREMLTRAPIGYRVLGFLTEHESEVGRTLVNPSVLGTLADLPRLSDSQDVTLIVVAQEDRRKRLPVDMLLRCRMAGVRVGGGGEPVREPVGTHPAARPAAELADLLGRLPEAARDVGAEAGRARRRRGAAARAHAAARGADRALRAAVEPGARALPADARRHERQGVRAHEVAHDARGRREGLGAGLGDGRERPADHPARPLHAQVAARRGAAAVERAAGRHELRGPRPERPHFVQKLRQVIPYYDERHSVRPGITGWAQVKFPYGSTIEDAEEKFEFDLYYVKHMSLLLDIAIVLETAKVMLLGRGR
jgi:hypothetical protein